MRSSWKLFANLTCKVLIKAYMTVPFSLRTLFKAIVSFVNTSFNNFVMTTVTLSSYHPKLFYTWLVATRIDRSRKFKLSLLNKTISAVCYDFDLYTLSRMKQQSPQHFFYLTVSCTHYYVSLRLVHRGLCVSSVRLPLVDASFISCTVRPIQIV